VGGGRRRKGGRGGGGGGVMWIGALVGGRGGVDVGLGSRSRMERGSRDVGRRRRGGRRQAGVASPGVGGRQGLDGANGERGAALVNPLEAVGATDGPSLARDRAIADGAREENRRVRGGGDAGVSRVGGGVRKRKRSGGGGGSQLGRSGMVSDGERSGWRSRRLAAVAGPGVRGRQRFDEANGKRGARLVGPEKAGGATDGPAFVGDGALTDGAREGARVGLNVAVGEEREKRRGVGQGKRDGVALSLTSRRGKKEPGRERGGEMWSADRQN